MPQDPQIAKEEKLNKLNVIISELNLIAAQVQNDEGSSSTGPLIADVAKRIADLLNSLGGHNPGNDDT